MNERGEYAAAGDDYMGPKTHIMPRLSVPCELFDPPNPRLKKSGVVDQSRRYSKRVMKRGSGAYSNVKVYSS